MSSGSHALCRSSGNAGALGRRSIVSLFGTQRTAGRTPGGFLTFRQAARSPAPCSGTVVGHGEDLKMRPARHRGVVLAAGSGGDLRDREAIAPVFRETARTG